MSPWFDSHCHLYDVEPSEDEAVAAARVAGVVGMLVVGVDVATSRSAAELAARSDRVWAGAAVHPSESKDWTDARAREIERLLGADRIVAVGETGLDFHWDTSFVDDQRRAFEAHIDLATRHDKALVIHTRRSVDAALEMLRTVGPPERVVFHCWSGDSGQLDAALDLGAYVSFAGNVSFKSADDLRQAAARVPGDRLLLETDSPYLAPEPRRGRTNAPANLPLVGSAVAAARGEEPDAVAERTTANAVAVFGIDPAELAPVHA